MNHISLDDHMLTTRRKLEEKWKEEKEVYIVSIDFKKAFDTVNHHIILIILEKRGAPYYLINNTIKVCLSKRTMA